MTDNYLAKFTCSKCDGHELTVGSVDVLPHAASSMAPVSIARRNGRIAPF